MRISGLAITVPAVGATRPSSARINVVLPDPFGADDRYDFAPAYLDVDIVENELLAEADGDSAGGN